MSEKLLFELIDLLNSGTVKNPEEADIIVRWDNNTVALYHVPRGSSLKECSHDALCFAESGEVVKARVYDLATADYVPPAYLAWRQKFLWGRTQELIERLKGKRFFHDSMRYPGCVPLSACLGGEADNADQIALLERPTVPV